VVFALPHGVAPGAQRTSVIWILTTTLLSSSGGPGEPNWAMNFMKPSEFACAPLASGVPTVR
jgi:hypothetical protein